MNATLTIDHLDQPVENGLALQARMQTMESWFLAAALGALMLLPATEILFRLAGGSGIAVAGEMTQHLTLLVGILGAVLAAERGRLLALGSGDFIQEKIGFAALPVVRNGIAAGVSSGLCIAGLDFVVFEHSAGGLVMAVVPLWLVLLLLPSGFAIISLHLLYKASGNWRGRLLALCIAGGPLVLAVSGSIEREYWLLPGLVLVGIALLLGAPIFVALGGVALVLFWSHDLPLAALALDHYGLVVNPTLPAIPLFTAAGYLLAEGGAPRRLVTLFHAVCGNVRGGLALVAIAASVFFTCLTGASGVAILALGGLLMPMLLTSGYRDRDALGLVTGAGTAGVLTPPSMPLILYAVVAQVGIEQMFLGSLIPALVMAALTLAWGLMKAPRGWSTQQAGPTPEIARAAWDAKWELLLPIVALGSLFGGFATPVEAAALTALYALLVQTLVHHELTWRGGVPRVLTECGLLVGGILLILGVAQGLTNFIIDQRIPDLAVDWVTAITTSPWLFLLALNGLLLVAGCLVDVFSAIIILTPILAPVGLAYGIDPIHLGVVILANLELGYLTPPVGMNLFYAAYRFERPILEVGRSVLSLFAMLAIGVLVITFIPWLSTVLVR